MAGYQYGTSPRKLEPDYNPYRQKQNLAKKVRPKKTAKQIKQEKKRKRMQTLTVLALFAILLTISYRNSLINESFTEVQTLKTELAALQKENEQLEVNIENSLNLNNIEQAAKEKLGMQKASSKQTKYVTLPKSDYIEVASEEVVMEDDASWITKVIDKVEEIFQK
jgi:cell division protein FtsL